MLLEKEPIESYAGAIEPESVYEIPLGLENNNNHNNNNNNQLAESVDENEIDVARGTPIQDFYAGQSIFITGGTGFLGKILIEKLLRSCPNISTIYLLIRNKKDKNAADRIEDLFNNPFYDRLKEVSPKFRHKIVGIAGDCSIRGLGLSAADRERLIREVSIVFHSAATVRFDEKMTTALAINVGSTLDMIDLCKGMSRLKAFIHVSTAYANCHLPKIEERFYPHVVDFFELEEQLRGIEDRELEKITPKLIEGWPNTYTFTKALAEVVIKERSKGLRVGIFRPAIVISCAYEPMPGWVDNFYGPTGAAAAVASGALRSIHFSPKSHANLIPVDFTVNALIASAWDVANQPERKEENMLIYNYVAMNDVSMTWEQYCKTVMVHAKHYPLSTSNWALCLVIHHNKVSAMIGKLFYHYIPAALTDFCRICLGYPPTIIKTYRKIDKFMNALTCFCTNNWDFTNDNVCGLWQRLDSKDQQIFRFNMKALDWNSYFKDYIKGLRVYLMKDDMSTLELSRRRQTRYIWIHESIKVLIYGFLLWIVWKSVRSIVL